MATKAVMEQQIMELRSMLDTARRDAELYKARYQEVVDNMTQTIEDAMYTQFKEMHGKMLERFMKEYLSTHLSVEVDGDEPGYIETKVIVDGEVTKVTDGSISVSSVCRY